MTQQTNTFDDSLAAAPSSTSPTKTAEVKDQVSMIGEDVRELGRLAREAAREEFAHLRAQGEEKAHQVREQASELEDSVRESVREQPIRHLAYAAGIGVALGLFLRR